MDDIYGIPYILECHEDCLQITEHYTSLLSFSQSVAT